MERLLVKEVEDQRKRESWEEPHPLGVVGWRGMGCRGRLGVKSDRSRSPENSGKEFEVPCN
jgi:hypothetical protein